MILRSIFLTLAAGYQLQQDVIGENSCALDKQQDTHLGTCECNKECCNGDTEKSSQGCPVDVVLAIDMCLCTNDTMVAYKRFGMELVRSLNTEFGISDSDNSARLHIFQFMEDVHDVVTFDTFTKGELIQNVLRMDYHLYHGKATNVKRALEHGAKILSSSPRADMEPRQVFVMISNGYSDDDLVRGQDVEAAALGLRDIPNLKTVFVAREDSSIPGDRRTHTNEAVAQHFTQRESLGQFLAPQQIVNDITCPAPPEVKLERECTCTCDVPMGCHGPAGPAGLNGKQGPNGKLGDAGEDGKRGIDGPMGDVGPAGPPGGCGMPGLAGEKGFPGKDGFFGVDGTPGALGNQGPTGLPGGAGAKGEMGEKGATGASGLEGVQGEPGQPGDPGAQGDQGGLDQETLKWLVNKIFIEELANIGIATPQT